MLCDVAVTSLIGPPHAPLYSVQGDFQLILVCACKLVPERYRFGMKLVRTYLRNTNLPWLWATKSEAISGTVGIGIQRRPVLTLIQHIPVRYRSKLDSGQHIQLAWDLQ